MSNARFAVRQAEVELIALHALALVGRVEGAEAAIFAAEQNVNALEAQSNAITQAEATLAAQSTTADVAWQNANDTYSTLLYKTKNAQWWYSYEAGFC